MAANDWQMPAGQNLLQVYLWAQNLVRTLQRRDAVIQVSAHVKTALPSATQTGRVIFVSDETGGAVLAFADGTNWRRVTDRAVVS